MMVGKQSDPLYREEEQALVDGEAVLAAGGDTVPTARYEALLTQYRKLLSQTKKIMRIADIMQADLNTLSEKWERLSAVDSLTGIGNRRVFDEMLEKEFSRAKRSGEPISLMIIDLDFFKLFNDTYGHLKGDGCLARISSVICSSLQRQSDFPARYGGEEFAVILPGTDLPGALAVAERIRANVAALAIPHATSTVCGFVTVSIGAACADIPDETTSMALLDQADKALYKAKGSLRNRVAC